jgi:ATP-dependent DNA ligase
VRQITRGGYDLDETISRCTPASTTKKCNSAPFDVLAMDGDDLHRLPLSMRKANLARLLARRPDGIFISQFEQGEIGPDLFRKACEFGLEGLVSKHRDRPYQGGRSKHWIKVKNRQHHAFDRVKVSFSRCATFGRGDRSSR